MYGLIFVITGSKEELEPKTGMVGKKLRNLRNQTRLNRKDTTK